jgi:hypothetical protein
MPRLRAHQEPAQSARTQVSALLERPGRCSLDRRSAYRAHARTGPRESRLHKKDAFERFAVTASSPHALADSLVLPTSNEGVY